MASIISVEMPAVIIVAPLKLVSVLFVSNCFLRFSFRLGYSAILTGYVCLLRFSSYLSCLEFSLIFSEFGKILRLYHFKYGF